MRDDLAQMIARREDIEFVRGDSTADSPQGFATDAQSSVAGVARSAPAAIERWQTNPPSRGRMSEHSHAANPPMQVETPEAFLADRQSFWNGFTKFTLGVVIFIVLLLVGMAIFLL